LDFDLEGMPEEARNKLFAMMPELLIAPSPLHGVVAVAQVAETGGITVELLSIEVREAGALLHWRARSDQPIGFLMPQVSASDQHSTPYRVLPADGGGDERSWAGSLALLPTPPSLAMLSVVFESFGADERMRMPGYVPREPIVGPWQFSVDTSDIAER
jgi:hypothetical protein